MAELVIFLNDGRQSLETKKAKSAKGRMGVDWKKNTLNTVGVACLPTAQFGDRRS